MHDHATDGGRRAFDARASARALRLHLDNAHDERTSGLDFPHLAELHRKAHKDAQLAEIAAAADLIADGLAAAPAVVFEAIVVDRSLVLRGADGTLYLAEEIDPRHVPAVGPLYRLTAQVPPAARIVDLLEATSASLAATRTYLGAHKESEGPIPSDAPRGGPVPPAVDPLAAPPSSEGVRSGLPRPADRPAPSGSAQEVR